jgi:Domain of unknown function (DUF4129)
MMKARPTKTFRGLCVAALFVAAWGACAQVVAAKPSTVAEYGQRVEDAELTLDELAELCDRLAEAGGESDTLESVEEEGRTLPFPQAQKMTLEEVRRLVPAREQVESGGSSFETDNTWLHQALQIYESESAKAATSYRMRAGWLREIAERLHALEVRLDETEQAAAAQAQRDKDAEKGRLNNILSRPEYNREVSEGGALQRLVEQFFKWLRDLFPRMGPARPGESPGVSRAAQFFVLALCLAVIAYVARKLWARRARNVKTKRVREPRVVLGERLEPGQTAADLLSAADRLARSGDLRGAIRKAYVALLCELGDRRVIRLAQHKTNRDYLQAIRSSASPRLYTEMLPLTFNFELHWYGLQDAEENDWKDFHQRCRQVLKSI